MRWLKICALIGITLSVMRAGSWAVGWALTRFAAARVRTVAVVSNFAAFTAFVLLLYFSLVPGEPMDVASVVFGLVVFAIYTATDCFWTPWRRRI